MSLANARSCPAFVVLLCVLAGCAAAVVGSSPRGVYHCVGTALPIPGPNQRGTPVPLEEFRYGDFVERDRPTVGQASHCAEMPIPKSALLRYRVYGQVVEKHFDLSKLTPARVSRGPEGGLRTVEFYVDGLITEVRIVTIVPGQNPRVESLIRQ